MNPILEAGIANAKINHASSRELTNEEAFRVGELAYRVLEIGFPRDETEVWLKCRSPRKLLDDLQVPDSASEVLDSKALRLRVQWRGSGARQAEFGAGKLPQDFREVFSFRALPAASACNEAHRLKVVDGRFLYWATPDTPEFSDIEIILNAFAPEK